MLYHFDTVEDGVAHVDDFGLELGSDREARLEAKRLAVDLMRDCRVLAGRRTITVEVRRGDGVAIFRTRLQLDGHPVARGLGPGEEDATPSPHVADAP